jgi:acetylornithine deacetylase/succinyl-diaminopimelate desuccinylase-like protein
MIDITLDLIKNGIIYCLYPVQAYMVHLEMRALVQTDEEMGREETEFYIKHADDKIDHIMVDEQGHITALVDWELSVFYFAVRYLVAIC